MDGVYDILVAGGGVGGVAAALRASAMGCRVLLLDENNWLGGQMTAQGVAALDEHKLMDTFGGTALYNAFRERVRRHYKTHRALSASGLAASPFNPGVAGRQRRFAFEPSVGAQVIDAMLLKAARLTVMRCARVVRVFMNKNRISGALVRDMAGKQTRRLEASSYIDATELGDLLPMAGIAYSAGEEAFAQTHEPSAPATAHERACQAFGYTFALEYLPGSRNVIEKPAMYDELANRRHYGLCGMRMFEADADRFSFFAYRQAMDPANFDDTEAPGGITLVNVPCSEYREDTLIDRDDADVRKTLHRAKQAALCYLYWLQTRAPRDDGGLGYPELRLRPDVMGTADGLSQYPYIRESRRMKGLDTVKEQDITAWMYSGGSSRARVCHDAVGIGWYPCIDIHPCCFSPLRPGSGQRVLPYQIPMGALLSGAAENFIAGAKNISMTHIANGALRMHPVEWSVGEAAGALAAFACGAGKDPLGIYRCREDLRAFQAELLKNGVPLYWFDDVPIGHESFSAVQLLALQGVITGEAAHLHFEPNRALSQSARTQWIARAKLRYGLSKQQAAQLSALLPGCTRAVFAAALHRFVAARAGLPQ